jgi:hypothetical protein
MTPPLSVRTTTGLYCVYYFQSWVDELILPSSVLYSIPRAKTSILPPPTLCSPSPEENPLHKYCSELQLRKHLSIFVLCIVIVRWICPMKPHAILCQRNLLQANSALVPAAREWYKKLPHTCYAHRGHKITATRNIDGSLSRQGWWTQWPRRTKTFWATGLLKFPDLWTDDKHGQRHVATILGDEHDNNC